MSISATIDRFLVELLDAAGITDAVVRETALHDVSLQLQEFLTLRLLEKLPVDARTEYLESMEAFPHSFDAYAFFTERIPGVEQVIADLLPEFSRTFLSGTSHA